MSRLAAGLGGGAGVVLGGIASAFLTEAFRARSSTAKLAVLAGAVLGGGVGGALGAGADCARSGTVGDPPAAPRQLRFP
jgi:hypothetical protein